MFETEGASSGSSGRDSSKMEIIERAIKTLIEQQVDLDKSDLSLASAYLNEAIETLHADLVKLRQQM